MVYFNRFIIDFNKNKFEYRLSVKKQSSCFKIVILLILIFFKIHEKLRKKLKLSFITFLWKFLGMVLTVASPNNSTYYFLKKVSLPGPGVHEKSPFFPIFLPL